MECLQFIVLSISSHVIPDLFEHGGKTLLAGDVRLRKKILCIPVVASLFGPSNIWTVSVDLGL